MSNQNEPTLGELRVRTTFNPDNNSDVDLIKQKTAELINLVENLKTADRRLVALAQTDYEKAAMWAVKAATSAIMKKPSYKVISFDELIKHGLQVCPPGNIHRGMPWSFTWEGLSITHENDNLYLVTGGMEQVNFNRGSKLYLDNGNYYTK